MSDGQETFTVRMVKYGSWDIIAEDNSGEAVLWSSQTIAGVTINRDDAVKLQVLLPGESALDGHPNGKTVTPDTQQAGTSFVVTARVTDGYWNKVLVNEPTVQLTITDTYGLVDSVLPYNAQKQLSAGENTFNVTLFTANTHQITVDDVDGTGTFYTSTTTIRFTVSPRAASKLLVLHPGETRVQGKYNETPYGKQGSPAAQVAGTAFTVTVYSCDAYYNLISTNVNVWLGSSNSADYYASYSPSTSTLVISSTYTVTLKREQNTFIRTYHDGGVTLVNYLYNPPYTNGPVAVGNNAATKVQILVPGESLDLGSSTGKTGTPSVQVAGTEFQLTLRLVDSYFNLVETGYSMPTARLTSTDGNDGEAPYGAYEGGAFADSTLTNGVAQPGWILITASTTGWTITADDIAPNSYTIDTSASIPVKPYTTNQQKLLVVLPGQAVQPGTLTGKSGASSLQTAGVAFNVTAYATDKYWNRINDTLYGISPTQGIPLVSMSDDDDNNSAVDSEALEDGVGTFSMMMVTAGSHTVTAADTDDSGVAFESYSTILSTVQANSAVKLQVLLPGETAAPGKAPYDSYTGGKNGSPATQTAGVAFNVTVRGTDNYWNIRNDATALVQVTADDVYYSTPSAMSLLGGTTVVSLTLVTGNMNHTIYAVDSDASPLAKSTSTAVTVAANASARLHVIVPGETLEQGKPPYDGTGGKLGSATVQTAGIAFDVTVYGVDNWYNRTSTSTLVWVTSSDSFDIHPSSQTLIQGTTGFRMTLVSATDAANWNNSGWRIYAYGRTTMYSSTSAAVAVTPNPDTTATARRLQVLVPGETAQQGKAPYTDNTGGKNSSVTTQTAGTAFDVTVNACDYWWNRYTSFNPAVNLVRNDPNVPTALNQVLVSGTTIYSVTLVTKTDSGWTLTGSAAGYTGFTTPNIVVIPNTASKLLVLMPNQVLDPGTDDGRETTGSTTQTAGTAFQVTVYACDNWFNYQPIESPSPNSGVRLETSDLYDTHPATRTLASGTTVFMVTCVTAGNGNYITVTDTSAPIMTANVSDTFTTLAAVPDRLQVLVPNQTALPGSPAGKSGTVQAQTAGVEFTVTVNATDAYWNLVDDASYVRIDTSDNWDIHPSTSQLVSGTTQFTVTLVSARTDHVISAVDTTAPALTTSTSTVVTVIPKTNIDGELKLQVIVPGETAEPGKWDNSINTLPFGKLGTPSQQTAGVPFTITVNLVDKYWNRVSRNAPLVSILSEDPYDTEPSNKTLQNGTTTFSITYYTSGWAIQPSSWSITVQDADTDTPEYSLSTSPKITVNPGLAKKLQIIVPGETWVAGKNTGQLGKSESSSPTAQVAGTTFTVTVQACDDYWNVRNDNPVVTVNTDDTNDTDPGTVGLTQGRASVDVTFLTATETGWVISSPLVGSYSAYTSPKVIVNPAPPTRLLCIVPNETYKPGSATGKTGTVIAQRAGIPFTVTALITDNQWNVVPSTSASLMVETEDPYDIHPTTAPTSSGVLSFDMEFHRAILGSTSYRITLSTAYGNPLTSYQTVPIESQPGNSVKLQLLVPGESADAGSSTGKTGAPNTQVADEMFNVTVNVVDKYWNLVSTDTTVMLRSSDPFFVAPSNKPTGLGFTNIWPTLVTATTTGWTLTASTATGATNGHLQNNTSPNIKVLAGAPSNLLVVLPGEQSLPGSSTGKEGTPALQTAGVAFPVTVYATDRKWNLCESTSIVKITTNDLYDIEPSTQSLVMGTTIFYIELVTANNGTQSTVNKYTTIFSSDVSPIPDVDKLIAGNAAVQLSPATASYLQLLMPGETHIPGKTPWYPGTGGKTGTPATLNAGTTYYVTVNACDKYWNINPSAQPLAKVYTTDVYDTDPLSTQLIQGSNTFAIKLHRATLSQGLTEKVTAYAQHDNDPQQYTPYFSPGFNVTPEPDGQGIRILLMLVPNQVHVPGSVTGKTGSVVQQTAGQPFAVTVHAVDSFNNIEPGAQPRVSLTSTDPNDGTDSETGIGWDITEQPLVNGSTVFMANLVTANTSHVLTAWDSDESGTYFGSVLSPSIYTTPGTPVKLQVVLPGETAKPNTASGKIGTPAIQTAGTRFDTTVKCTDVLWNVVTGANPTVRIETNDVYDTEPAAYPLQDGEGAFGITLITANTSHSMWAYDTGLVYSTGTSTMFTVQKSTWTRLFVMLPGETWIPGKPPYDGTGGKSGTPNIQTAGSMCSITVYATDNYYNLNTGADKIVSVTTTDKYDDPVTAQAGLSFGVANFNLVMVTADTQTITAQTSAAGVSTGTANVYIQPSTKSRLLVLAPGEVQEPGEWGATAPTASSPYGKTGTPVTQTAGVAFNVTVKSCDAYFNTVSETPVVTLATDDNYDTEPSAFGLSNGIGVSTVTLVTEKQTVITATANSYTSNVTQSINVNPNAPNKLIVLVPGETAVNGKHNSAPFGKTGTPTTQTAGVAFNVTVRCVDDFWNITSSAPAVLTTSQDNWDIEPSTRSLSNGSTTFAYTLVTATTGGFTITATDQNYESRPGGAYAAYTSTKVVVIPNTVRKLQVLVPGESIISGKPFNGSYDSVYGGKTGSTSLQAAGVPFTVTVTACDDYWNLVSSEYSEVNVVSSDPWDVEPINEVLMAGTTGFTFTMVTASTVTFTASNPEGIRMGGSLYAYTSNITTVTYNTASKLQLLLPGETAVPGKPVYTDTTGGKTGTPSNQRAGVAFTVTVNAVDNYWNRIANNTTLVNMQTSDLYDDEAVLSTKSLIAGTTQFTVTLVTADMGQTGTVYYATSTLTALSNSGYASYTSPQVAVYPNSAVKLQVLVAGETAVPGKYDNGNNSAPYGKSGTPSTITAGVGFYTTVNAVDTWWNRDNTWSQLVTVQTSDPYDKESIANALLYGKNSSFLTALVSASSTATVTATTGAGLASDQSPYITVVPNTVKKLVTLLPNQTLVNGKNTQPEGRTGTVASQYAGVKFHATVAATDDYYNLVSTVNHIIEMRTTDPYGIPGISPVSYTNADMYNGIAIATITFTTANQNRRVEAYDGNPAEPVLAYSTSSLTWVYPGEVKRLQVLLPGEVGLPGSPSGKTSALPTQQIAGVPFNVTVNAADEYWNLTPATPTVVLTTADLYDTEPAPQALVNGYGVFSVSLVTASTSTVTVADTGFVPDLDNNTSAVVNVYHNSPAKLVAILPGQTFVPGSSSGKTGTPATQTAGTTFNATVRVVDSNWNWINDLKDLSSNDNSEATVDFSSPLDNYDTLETAQQVTTSGQVIFVPQLIVASTSHYLTFNTRSSPSYTGYNTSVFTVRHNMSITHLQVLVPGMTRVPGKVTNAPESLWYRSSDDYGDGRTGAPRAQTAGVPFLVTANLVDSFYNLANTVGQPNVKIQTSDPYDTEEPSGQPLNLGTREFVVTLRSKASNNTVTALDDAQMYLQNTSPQFVVNSSAPVKLLVLLPGEQAVYGSSYGRYEVYRTTQIAGNGVSVRVNLVDAYNNIVESVPTGPMVRLQTNNPHPNNTMDSAELQNGSNLLTVNFKTAGTSWTVTAVDASTPTLYASGTSSEFTMYPSDAYRLGISDVPSIMTAGEAVNVRVTAYDQYENIVGTGPKIFKGQVYLDAQTYSSDPLHKQNPTLMGTKILTGDTLVKHINFWQTFVEADNGTHMFNNTAILRKAGTQWIRAIAGFDGYNEITKPTGIRDGLLSNITVRPGELANVIVDPVINEQVSAGSPAEIGRRQITGQLSDLFDNTVATTTTVSFEVFNVRGATGTIKTVVGGLPAEVVISTVTDTLGRAGFSIPYYLFISTKAGDYCQVKVSVSSSVYGVSGVMTTIGGVPYKIVVVDEPDEILAGIISTPFTVERRDYFNNATWLTKSNIPLVTNAPGDNISDHSFYLPEAEDNIPITFVEIFEGQTQVQFRYSDKWASYPANDDLYPGKGAVGEFVRPSTGKWIITMSNVGNWVENYPITVHPNQVAKVGFDTPSRTLRAGLFRDANTNVTQKLQIELQDQYGNPRVATQTVIVNLLSDSLANYLIDDFSIRYPYSFSLSSNPWVHTTSVTIEANNYYSDFYYRDTRASDRYNPKGTKPTVTADARGFNSSWVPGTQLQVIKADYITQLNFTNALQTLKAGATSYHNVQLQDKYENPSPVKMTDFDAIDEPFVRVNLWSDSSGQVRFSSGSARDWRNTTYQLQIASDSYDATVWHSDTKAGQHNIYALDNKGRGWGQAKQVVTVTPEIVSKIVFTTLPRRLIAGTTIEYFPDYETGSQIDTVMQLQTRDRYDNESPVTEDKTIKLYSTSKNKRFNATATETGWSEDKDLIIQTGQSVASFYYQDTMVASPTVTGTEFPGQGWEDAQQQQVITPNAATYFSINHNYETTGLSVDTPGIIRVTARDKNQNIATGDPINGQYYTGKVMYWTISTTATANPPMYRFTKEDSGVSTFLLQDVMQEKLIIGATDYDDHSIHGVTNDGAHSSADLDTVGVLMIPTDIAPEDGDQDKADKGIAKALYQGQGTMTDTPSPAAMMFMRLAVAPLAKAATNYANLTRVRIYKKGTLPYNQVTEVALYKDKNGNGTFEGDKTLNDRGSASDTYLCSAKFNVQDYADLELPSVEKIADEEIVLFITVRIPVDADRDKTLGVEVRDSGHLFMTPESTAKTAKNNFPALSYESIISVPPEKVSALSKSVSATYIDLSQDDKPVITASDVPQGTPNAAMLMLGFWTKQFPGRLDKIKVMHIVGDQGSDTDIKDVKLWLDSNRNKTFDPNLDVPVSKPISFESNAAYLDIINNTEYDQITPATNYYFITFGFNDSAVLGSKHAAEILFHPDIVPIDCTINTENAESIWPMTSGKVTVTATKDTMVVKPVFVGQGSATQGDKDFVMVRLDMNALSHTVIWKSLKLDRTGGGGDSDIKEINIYKDLTPKTSVVQQIEVTDTVIWVNSTRGFLDNGTLAIGTEKINYMSKVSSNSMAGFLVAANGRGVENTTAQVHKVDSEVVGRPDGMLTEFETAGKAGLASITRYDTAKFANATAEVKITEEAKWNEITMEGVSYFVTFNIDYLAKVGSTRLGLKVNSTSYFEVGAPDLVSTENIPFPATLSQINEFADEVVFSAYEHTTSTKTERGVKYNPYTNLMQGSKNNEIMTISAEASNGDALWKGVNFKRVGSVDSKDTDVERVTIWHDTNNNKSLDDSDIMVGTGTFYNRGRENDCYIEFSSNAVQTVYSRKKQADDNISNTYIVTMDLSEAATPGESLGIYYNHESFFVSKPNYISSTTVHSQFTTNLRKVIPSPREVTIKSEPVNCMVLNEIVDENMTAVSVNSTSGFPSSGYVVVDNEVMLYSSMTPTSLYGILRAQFETTTVAHSSGSVIAGSISQGMRNVPLLKMTLSCDKYYVMLYGLKVNLFTTGIDKFVDSDVERVYVYKDNDNKGIFDRNEYGENRADTKVGEAVPGGTSGVNTAEVTLEDMNYSLDTLDGNGKRYVLITTTPTVYFIAADISPTAVEGHFFGVAVNSKDNFNTSQQHLGIDVPHSVKLDNNIRSGTPGVLSTVDKLIVKAETILPATATQGEKNVAVMKLNLQASDNAVIWRGLKLDCIGDVIDNDVSVIKVYRDMNNNGKFENKGVTPIGVVKEKYELTDKDLVPLIVDTTAMFQTNNGFLLINHEIVGYKSSTMTLESTTHGMVNRYIFTGITRGLMKSPVYEHDVDAKVYGINSDVVTDDAGYAPGLISKGLEQYVSKTSVLTFLEPQAIYSNIGGQNYFIAYDIYDMGGVNKKFGVSLADTSYFIIDTPDYVNPADLPIESALASIGDYPDRVTFTPVDIQDYPAPVVTQGDKDIVMCAFTMKTDKADAVWTALQVQRIGTGNGTTTPMTGTNKDVGNVKIYLDDDDSGFWEVNDKLITSGIDKFPVDDNIGPNLTLTLTSPQIITQAAKKYFVLYDIADDAQAGDTLGLKIPDTVRIVVNQPNTVASTNMPFETLAKSKIDPIQIIATGDNLAPAAEIQGRTVPLLQIRLKTNKNKVKLTGFTLRQNGSIEKAGSTNYYPEYYGEGDLTELKVYRDVDNDNLFTSTDTLDPTGLIGYVINNSINFKKGSANIIFSTATEIYITSAGNSLFITGTLGAYNENANDKTEYINTEKHEVQIEIPGIDQFIRTPKSSVGSSSSVYPIRSLKVMIKHLATPEVQYIDADTKTPGIQTFAWINKTSEVKTAWRVVLPTGVGNVELTQVYYAVGTSSIAVLDSTASGEFSSNSQSWKKLDMSNITADTNIETTANMAVSFKHGKTYYFHLKASARYVTYLSSSIGKASIMKVETKDSEAKHCTIKIDLTPPLRPVKPVPEHYTRQLKVIESGSFVVNWVSAFDPTPAEIAVNETGSGIKLYEIQERSDTNPVWKTIEVVDGQSENITVGNYTAFDVNGNVLVDDPRPQGHFYYYRVRALNNAGSWSDWSEASDPASTGLPKEPISDAHVYPNPVDSRKGGEEGKARIAYILNENAGVTITLYDLLGYVVRQWQINPGDDGAKVGANTILWDCKNETGEFVSKGGYIAKIEVKAAKGTVTQMIKIGLVH
ncbi:MAG: hypothetical protein WC955_02445 [Elusimicrobiota bacterium]